MSEQLWQRIQTSLDAAQDPLDDAFLCRSLLRNPELLEDFAELRSGLRSLAFGRGILVPSEIRQRCRMASAALTLSLLAALFVFGVTQGAERESMPKGRILELSLELSVESPGQRAYESFVRLPGGTELRRGRESPPCDSGQDPGHASELRRFVPADAGEQE